MFVPARWSAAILIAGLFGLGSRAWGQVPGSSSRALEFRFTPTARTQMALWIEKPDGTFMKTVGLTQSVSIYGIGNRPGAAQMNSGFRWPYGRREGVLPVWAHRRSAAAGAAPFLRVIFQNRQSEGFASLTTQDSSPDPYFCLSFDQASTPEMRRQDFIDAITCASRNRFMSDKGRYVTNADVAAGYAEPAVVDGQAAMRQLSLTSLYPPRRDLKPCAGADCAIDTADVARFVRDVRTVMPDIDAITMATPAPDLEQTVMFTVPPAWEDGDYVAWIEVNVEGDYNAAFNDQAFPTPMAPEGKWDSWAMGSGYPYRGQPSVVFQVPFKLGTSATTVAIAPTFYGDLDGFGDRAGDLHPLDGRITDDPIAAPGQGADRLRLIAPSGHRVQVTVRGRDVCAEHEPPSTPIGFIVSRVGNEKHTHEWGRLSFTVPFSFTPIVHYQARFSTNPILAGSPETFERALPALAPKNAPEALAIPVPELAGSEVSVDFGGLSPLTHYFVAIRAVDSCNVAGPHAVAEITTTRQNFTQLSGCFIATAAYGTPLEPRVQALRLARDSLRPGSALVTLGVDLYDRAGPAAAAVIARSEAARAVVRVLVAPVAALAQTAFSSPPSPTLRRAGRDEPSPHLAPDGAGAISR